MKKNEYKERNLAYMDEVRQRPGIRELRGGVLAEVIASGESDRQVGPRSIVTCHYRGQLINGKTFDSTYESKCPAAFRVNELISGFQIALVQMHPGDHWRVYIPAEMGYGSRGAGRDIPGHSTLIFEIELLSVG